MTGTLHEDRYTFVIISSWILLRMTNTSSKNCREIRNTHFMFKNFFIKKSCRLWANVEKKLYSRTGHRWRMRTAWWITKATNTHSEYVTITAFPTATMVARTRLRVTFQVHGLSCYERRYNKKYGVRVYFNGMVFSTNFRENRSTGSKLTGRHT